MVIRDRIVEKTCELITKIFHKYGSKTASGAVIYRTSNTKTHGKFKIILDMIILTFATLLVLAEIQHGL